MRTISITISVLILMLFQGTACATGSVEIIEMEPNPTSIPFWYYASNNATCDEDLALMCAIFSIDALLADSETDIDSYCKWLTGNEYVKSTDTWYPIVDWGEMDMPPSDTDLSGEYVVRIKRITNVQFSERLSLEICGESIETTVTFTPNGMIGSTDGTEQIASINLCHESSELSLCLPINLEATP